MLTLKLSQLPVSEQNFRASLIAYRDALVAHASTEEMPAPFPAHEVFRDILAADKDGNFVLVDDTPQPPPLPAPLTQADWVESKINDTKAEAQRRILTRLPGATLANYSDGLANEF